MIRYVPERKIDGKWTKEQVLEYLRTLKNCGFRVRAKVSDNHPAKV